MNLAKVKMFILGFNMDENVIKIDGKKIYNKRMKFLCLRTYVSPVHNETGGIYWIGHQLVSGPPLVWFVI